MNKPDILITMGDPSGIGPEIIIKALQNKDIYKVCRPVVVGSPGVLEKTAQNLNIDTDINIFKKNLADESENRISVIESGDEISKYKYGFPDSSTGKNVFSYIKDAIHLCMENKADAMATAPINKTTLKDSGINFDGHTEILAHYSNTEEYAMMMYGKKLSVVLVTIHIPLSEVPGALTKEKILKKIILTHNCLTNNFGIKNPKIALCGLNPHAGENSLFGNEEKDIIIPAAETARKKGINITEPLPPDTVFFYAKNAEFDAVLCMYHDQGLIPFKLLHFEDGVNTTIGLPFPRTSVDHGTAYNIAGQNSANPQSMIQAIKLASFQAFNLKNKS